MSTLRAPEMLSAAGPQIGECTPYLVRMSADVRTHTEWHERYLSVAQVATRLGVGAPTVRRWIAEGHVRAVQPGGMQGVLRVPATELERLARGEDR
jgi:excisionase family DNA binding protein